MVSIVVPLFLKADKSSCSLTSMAGADIMKGYPGQAFCMSKSADHLDCEAREAGNWHCGGL